MDDIPGRKRVFILGGGAALGAHQVGVIRYLEEIGIKPDALICSSIGVINGCVYGTGGVMALEEQWRNFHSLSKVMYPTRKDNPITGLSMFSIERIASAIEEFIDFPKLLDSRLDLEFILLNLSRGRGEMWSQSMCRDWRELRAVSRAGYSIPPLFPPVEIRGEYFTDGGLAWNIPLEHALEVNATEIYVLAPISSQLPYHAEFRSAFSYYKRLLDVLWRTIGNMGHLYARIEDGRFHGVPVTIIEPGEELSGFSPLSLFNSTPKQAGRLIAAGYRDAKRTIERPAGAVRTDRAKAV